MVSSKKGQSVNGKSGLHKAEAVQGKVRKDQFQSGGCIDFSSTKLDICTATDPVTVFDVPQNLSTRTSSLFPHPLTIHTGGPGEVLGDTYLKPLQIETHQDHENDTKQSPHLVLGGSGDRPKIITPTSKLLKTTGACSRTTPVIWSPALGSESSAPIKEELCPTSSSELRRSYTGSSGMNFVNIKIEPRSPNCLHTQALESNNRESLITTMDMSNSQMGAASHYTAAGQIPVGIAVARQRLHPDPVLQGGSCPTNAAIKDMHTTRHIGGSAFAEMIQSPQLTNNMGHNIFLSAPPSAPAIIGPFSNDSISVQSQAMRTPSAIWQYPMEQMQMPMPPMGLQLVREPTTGQYIFVPAMEPYPQTLVWPYANVQPSQPTPIQFLGASDYLSASTTLHQHTQTSTRLVALANNDLKQRYIGNTTTGGGIQTQSGDPAPLMSIMNKVPSLSSHLLPTSLNNTIIKIEDNNNCAISTGGGGGSSFLAHHDPSHGFSTGPTLSAELMSSNLHSGFLMPHTPMLTPAPSLFDMNEKPFLANIAQQQRHFQFNLKSEACPISTSDGATLSHSTDFNSLMYAQSTRVGQDFQLSASTSGGAVLPALTSLDTSSMTLGGHSSLMLTPDTVISARSTGGLLTPPSPMPQQKTPMQLTSSSAGSGHSLLSLCSMDGLSGSVSGQPVDSERDTTTASNCGAPVVQDATMQTDTPVCSDEENTQDTTSGVVTVQKETGDSESDKLFETTSTVGEEECHNDHHSTSEVPPVLASKQCQDQEDATTAESCPAVVVVEPSEPVKSVRTEPVDLSGLELLSNSIEAFETIKRETGAAASRVEQGTSPNKEFASGVTNVTNERSANTESEATPTAAAEPMNGEHETQPQSERPLNVRVHNEQFDGLNLLCALAEQRLVEEEEGEEGEGSQLQDRMTSDQIKPQPCHETQPNDEGPAEKLSDLERDIKQRLADLTRQCEEKRRELDKMEKINPFYRMGSYPQSSYPVPSKFVMSDDEETRSSQSASVRTPLTPTMLFGTNGNGQSHCSAAVDVPPKASSDTESSKYDDSDLNALEKMSKRKGGVPKRGDCSETETIVAKKPKSLVGYIFSKKNRNENKTVPKKTAPLIKHGQLRSSYSNSPSSGSASSEPVKFEPIKIKEEIIDEEVSQDAEGSENNPFSFMSPRFTSIAEEMPAKDLFKASRKSDEERHSSGKHRKRSKAKKRHHKDGEGKRRRTEVLDNRCKLTDAHLDDKEKKTRVLTSMGGLFYAGVLSPIQPPDIYSVILDGERGNRPHIMSREEVQRDAILEIVPTALSEVPPGTRLCAYWSQQYRCLYPGTAAQPGTPDVNSQKQYISVEFDDGDSGRILVSDIRLLFKDYPIVEYDPNPLLSLGKRKGRVSGPSTVPAQTTGSIFNSLNEPTTSSDLTSRLDRAAEKERRRLKRMKKHLMKKQQLLPCCSHQPPIEDGSKKRMKCSDELCKHRKHKKKRKHKRQERDAAATVLEASAATQDEEEEGNAEEEEEEDEDGERRGEEDNKFKSVDTEDTEETMDSCSAVDDPDFKDPTNKKKEHHSPDQNKSKIAAFLPARQLWAWAGESYRRSCVKGRVKKQFYKMIQRGKETIEIGDSAVFLSTGRADRPYIGRITSMWKTNSCNMIVRVKWFYHPEEAQGSPNLKYPGGLFESSHEDENDVQTISHKCEVLSVYDFTKKLGDEPKNLSMIYDNNDTYYLAGHYDPTALSVNMQPNIPINEESSGTN